MDICKDCKYAQPVGQSLKCKHPITDLLSRLERGTTKLPKAVRRFDVWVTFVSEDETCGAFEKSLDNSRPLWYAT